MKTIRYHVFNDIHLEDVSIPSYAADDLSIRGCGLGAIGYFQPRPAGKTGHEPGRAIIAYVD